MKTKLDSAGRVYIPKEVRERVRAEEFIIEITDEGDILLKPINIDPIEKYYGAVRGEHMPVEVMEEKVKRAIKEIYENDIR